MERASRLRILHAPPSPGAAGYWERFRIFFTHGLPVVLGLHANEHWLHPALRGVYLALLALIVAGLLRGIRRMALAALVVAMYPFVFAAFPPSHSIGEGRYLLFLAPVLWLAVVNALRMRGLLVCVLVAAPLLSVSALRAIRDTGPQVRGVAMPPNDTALVRSLREHGIKRIVGSYWIVYRVTFESRERTVGTPEAATDVRSPALDRQVRDAPRPPAHVFLAGDPDERDFANRAAAHPGCFERVVVERFVVYAVWSDVSDGDARRRCSVTSATEGLTSHRTAGELGAPG